MTYTYSNDPIESDIDGVRFWVQDVGGSSGDYWLLSDEEIQYLIDTWLPSTESVIWVAAVAAEVISSKFAGEVSVSADGVSVSVSDLQRKYKELAFQLREQYKALAVSVTGPIVSGLMFDTVRDPSIKPLMFGTGFMDEAEAGRQEYGDRHPGAVPGFGDDTGVDEY